MIPLVDVLVRRRAFRGLAPTPLAPEVVRSLFEGAVLAPSYGNMQPYRFVAVEDPETLGKLKALLTPGNYWAQKAPLVVAVVTHLDWSGRLEHGREFALFDAGQAALALQLQATQLGLIAHPIAGFDPVAAAALLNLPEGAILPALIIVGHPGPSEGLSEKHLQSENGPRTRKPLEQILSFNTYT